MATRLTAFSKFFITLLILGVIAAGGYYLLNRTSFGSNLKQKAEETKKDETSTTEKPKTNFNDDENTLVVQLVTWGGYGPGYISMKVQPQMRIPAFSKSMDLKFVSC